MQSPHSLFLVDQIYVERRNFRCVVAALYPLLRERFDPLSRHRTPCNLAKFPLINLRLEQQSLRGHFKVSGWRRGSLLVIAKFFSLSVSAMITARLNRY
jgi:hypothetical protein